VLESDGTHERQEWFGCACCPSNICRFIPSVPSYVYATDEEGIYVNLYMSNEAEIDLNGKNVKITQETEYPYDGKIVITVEPEKETQFELRLRIPGWARNEAIDGDLYRFIERSKNKPIARLNGENVKTKEKDGYIVFDQVWEKGDYLSISYPMDVRMIIADKKVKEDSSMLAVQRGPLVYTLEWVDNYFYENYQNNPVEYKRIPEVKYDPNILNVTQIISISVDIYGGNHMMRALIPYHLWNNRGPGPMRVWLPY
jgi:DUF1680 family protein